MPHLTRRRFVGSGISAFAGSAISPALALEQRNEVSFLRGPYNMAQYKRHNYTYRLSAGMHFFHSKQHDLLQLTPLADHAQIDAQFARQATAWLEDPPRTEPKMEYYSSYVSRAMHTLFRTIDWTHMHHEQTYDVMAYQRIGWPAKPEWTDRSVWYYLLEQTAGVPRSCAPLDVTMRRAGVMMKPYFTYFRNYYPKDQALFFVAHWWHPAVYEGQMISGNRDQEIALKQVNDTMWREVMPRKPQRMLLSREVSPRYARMSPESGNIFDNLHMLHGLAYDILAYEGWTVAQKRAEMYRVIKAMGYQPGDEHLARKFREPRPLLDPRTYPAWLRSPQGEMSRIMMEMMMEMMPLMMPGGMSPELHARVMAQFKKKMRLGLEPGEIPGSLGDALKALMPGMRMVPGASEPGETPHQMVKVMLEGWRRKYGDMPDIPPMDMSVQPRLVGRYARH